MTTFDDALQIILSTAARKGNEIIDFNDSLGRVLARDVVSDIDMPPFNKSAMDGFACRRKDLGKALKIIDTVAAGSIPAKGIGQGECTRIMTGAMVPEGADCVIKVEETGLDGDGRVVFTGDRTKDNISFKAEDIRKGDVVLTSGTRLRPQHIAILASVGCTRPEVALRPDVAIISTGDEIVEPGIAPGPSQIRNSNGHQLTAQVSNAGAVPSYLGIAADNEEVTSGLVEKALDDHDILLLSGGVSMGDYDFIPMVLERAGVNILFRTLLIQPGKPTVFGTRGDKKIFGLPGNPVSSFNIFTLLVVPLLNAMMGCNTAERIKKLPLGSDYRRNKAGRLSWIPVKTGEDGKIYPIEYHGSAHIHALAEADGIAGIPAGMTECKTGQYLDVRFI